jgi:hypothetical protein
LESIKALPSTQSSEATIEYTKTIRELVQKQAYVELDVLWKHAWLCNVSPSQQMFEDMIQAKLAQSKSTDALALLHDMMVSKKFLPSFTLMESLIEWFYSAGFLNELRPILEDIRRAFSLQNELVRFQEFTANSFKDNAELKGALQWLYPPSSAS